MADKNDLSRRLEFIGLHGAGKRALAELKPQLDAVVEEALRAFYAHIRAFEETNRFFTDDTQVARAGKLQLAHWNKILEGSHDGAYVDSVRRIGAVHARIGLEPRWYIGSYALVLSHLFKSLFKKEPQGRFSGFFQASEIKKETAAEGFVTLMKSILLDMDFVISTYFEIAEENRRSAEAKAIDAEQKIVVESIGRGLKHLTQGDLTFRLTAELPAAYEQLRHDYNEAVSKLDLVVHSIAAASAAIQSTASELANAADDLSRRTEQQAASLEETAAALDEITASIRETAAGTTATRKNVETARQEAEAGTEIVVKSIDAMEQIASSSKQISEIVGVIDEMAFQTNLLALNAGVEAARAGESGRGFAVVASEVRALAQRSADAAKQINTLIGRSSGEVKIGVDLVNDAGQALSKITDNATLIASSVSNIDAGTREQSVALAEVNTAMGQLDQLTQQNAAMVEQSTAATRSVLNEVEDLVALVSGFKTSAAVEQAPVQLRRLG